MRRVRRALALALAAVLGSVLLYAAAVGVLGLIPVGTPARAPGGIEVFVASNGFHTDLFLPRKALEIDFSDDFPIGDFRNGHPAATHVAVGWGDREFYLATPRLRDLKPGTVLNALVGSGRTVMHVGLYFRPEPGPSVYRLSLDPDQYRQLAAWVRGWLAANDEGRPRVVSGAGYGDHDAFYEAVGSYSVILTCNEWLAQGLRHIGVRTAFWSPLPFAVTHHLDQAADSP